MSDIIKRTTLMVRNADIAANWYANVFGMRRWMDVPFTLSGNQLAAGKRGDQTRLIIMQAEHDVIGMIGLLEWTDPQQDYPKELPTRIAFGAPIFVVAAKDCRASTEKARAMGSHIFCEPYPCSVTGAKGELKSMLGASFFDLDGYFYEVNETLP